MCNAPDILINLRFIVSNLCTKSIIDANYGILSRLSRSDRFFKVNFARVIRFKVFKTLKFGTPKLLRNYSIATFFQFLIYFDAAKSQGKETILDFLLFRWQTHQNSNSGVFLQIFDQMFFLLNTILTKLPNS